MRDRSDESPTSHCCLYCYHYGYCIGRDGRTCELSGKHKKNPRLYTNCKSFGYVDIVTGAKVVDEEVG